MNALIGSGFCSTSNEDHYKKVELLSIWLKNVGERDVVIVENTDAMLGRELNPDELPDNVRVIRVSKNLGHIENMLGKLEPKFCGWTISWMIPALIAYSEGRDLCYFEQDCLAFGDWELQIRSDMEAKGLLMAFGEGSKFAVTEQSIMVIKCEFIPTAISMYLAIPKSDGCQIPESKFWILEHLLDKVGRFTLFGGRNRPIPETGAFYLQKITDEEMTQLRARKLI